jgi:hypothetical protein
MTSVFRLMTRRMSSIETLSRTQNSQNLGTVSYSWEFIDYADFNKNHPSTSPITFLKNQTYMKIKILMTQRELLQILNFMKIIQFIFHRNKKKCNL